MRAQTTITLDAKECAALIAKALGIPAEKVKPLKYNFGLVDLTEAEASELLRRAGVEYMDALNKR